MPSFAFGFLAERRISFFLTDAQRRELKTRAVQAGYDDLSAYLVATLREALGRLEAGEADTLVVVKLDRLTRSVVDLKTLLEAYFAGRFGLVA